MKTVWVVMGNDYPDAVFSTEEAAEAHCALQRLKTKRIHWRVYGFAVRK
jgi:hypothetical protein